MMVFNCSVCGILNSYCIYLVISGVVRLRLVFIVKISVIRQKLLMMVLNNFFVCFLLMSGISVELGWMIFILCIKKKQVKVMERKLQVVYGSGFQWNRLYVRFIFFVFVEFGFRLNGGVEIQQQILIEFQNRIVVDVQEVNIMKIQLVVLNFGFLLFNFFLVQGLKISQNQLKSMMIIYYLNV